MHNTIKTFEDACRALNIQAQPTVSGMPDKHTKAIEALCKLTIIAEALNGGWVPDWDNEDEKKYYPWFVYNGSGVGFSCAGTCCDYAGTCVGSRLCFKTRELAEYAGKQFKDLYNDFLIVNQ